MRVVHMGNTLRYSWLLMTVMVSVGMRGSDSIPPVPKRVWVVMVGSTWTHAINKKVNFKGDGLFWRVLSDSYYRKLQPYVGIEMLTHVGDRWIYSVAMSYHERYTDNLFRWKYYIRSVNVEIHGGKVQYPRRAMVPFPYFFMPHIDTVTFQGYLTVGAYAGRILSVVKTFGEDEEVEGYSPWDAGVKVRLFGHYYKYRESQKFFAVQVELTAGLSLVKLFGYYLYTAYFQDYTASDYPPVLIPTFRLNMVL